MPRQEVYGSTQAQLEAHAAMRTNEFAANAMVIGCHAVRTEESLRTGELNQEAPAGLRNSKVEPQATMHGGVNVTLP